MTEQEKVLRLCRDYVQHCMVRFDDQIAKIEAERREIKQWLAELEETADAHP